MYLLFLIVQYSNFQAGKGRGWGRVGGLKLPAESAATPLSFMCICYISCFPLAQPPVCCTHAEQVPERQEICLIF